MYYCLIFSYHNDKNYFFLFHRSIRGFSMKEIQELFILETFVDPTSFYELFNFRIEKKRDFIRNKKIKKKKNSDFHQTYHCN